MAVCHSHLAAAAYNGRISHTDMSLNQSVELTFNTPKPQRLVDIGTSLQQQLAAIAVRDDWAVLSIHHHSHEKMGDVSVSIALRPRHAGELPSPELVPEWLENPLPITLPTVMVRDQVLFGTEQRTTPVEVLRVHGYPWSMPLADLSKQIKRDTDGLFPVQEGLRLGFVNGQLGEAHLQLQGVNIQAALPSLQQRWGSALSLNETEATWLLGWVSIRAQQVDGNTQIVLTHEGIRRQSEASKVESQVFRLLDDPHQQATEVQEVQRTQQDLDEMWQHRQKSLQSDLAE